MSNLCLVLKEKNEVLNAKAKTDYIRTDLKSGSSDKIFLLVPRFCTLHFVSFVSLNITEVDSGTGCSLTRPLYPCTPACGALSEQEARNAVKWDVIVTIAAAFGRG